MLQGKAGKKKKKKGKTKPTALGSYGEVYPVHKLLNPTTCDWLMSWGMKVCEWCNFLICCIFRKKWSDWMA